MAVVMASAGRVTCRKCGEPCELAGCPTCSAYPELGRVDRDVTIKRIRAALRQRSGKTWSVRGDRGTAWGWINISCPPARLACDRLHEWDADGVTCRFCSGNYLDLRAGPNAFYCPEHTAAACDERCYRHYLSPEEARELADLLGFEKPVHQQGVSIAASSDHYVEYIDRAEGRTPRKFGTQYWD